MKIHPGATAGWNRAAPVVVTLDLGATASFDAISLNVHFNLRGELHVPAQVFVYAGRSSETQRYVGDSAHAPKDAEGAGAKIFDVNFAPVQARFITILIYPRGDYLILDEMSVRQAQSGKWIEGGFSPAQIFNDARERRRSYAEHVRSAPQGDFLSQRWAAPASKSHLDQGCQVKRVNPWAHVHLDTLADLPLHETAIVRAPNVPARTAWLVVNNSKAPVNISAHAATRSAHIRAVSFVQTLDYKWAPDAPVRFEKGSLPASSAMLVLADFYGDAENADLAFLCDGRAINVSAPMKTIRSSSSTKALHGTLWPYLRGAAKNLTCKQNILSVSGSDTGVVPPSALNSLINSQADHELRQYFRAFRSAARIHLFMDLARPEWRQGSFAPELWREAFTHWWLNLRKIAKDEKISGELFLYPYDEIAPANIAGLEAFRNLFSSIDPQARFFGTIDRQASAPAIRSLDVVQLLDKQGVSNISAAEAHLYATQGNARSLSPHSYYRLQGWKAYTNAYAGVGIWSLWEGDGADDPESGWSPFGSSERDYAMAYRGHDNCLFPSRRLLAWMQGRDDYTTLKACEPTLGRARLHKIASRVLSANADALAPDRALNEIADSCGANEKQRGDGQ